MLHRPSWAALVAAAALTLTGCASAEDEPSDDPAASADPSPTESATESPTESATPSPTEPAGTTVAITIQGGQVTPNGATVEAARGEPVTLKITSDVAGELHVHSTPEQYVEFPAGSSTHEVTFDKPGVVEVEDHETGKVVVKLQVR